MYLIVSHLTNVFFLKNLKTITPLFSIIISILN